MLGRCKHRGLIAEADEVFGDNAARLVIADRNGCIQNWCRANAPRDVRGRSDTDKSVKKIPATSQLHSTTLEPTCFLLLRSTPEGSTRADNRQKPADVRYRSKGEVAIAIGIRPLVQ